MAPPPTGNHDSAINSISAWPRLRALHPTLKVALTFTIFVLVGGFLASALQIDNVYRNRDSVPGLSMDDIMGGYHGVHKPASMLRILEEGHSNAAANTKISDNDKQILLTWLRSDRISENYDNLDLGESAPAEVIARDCASCHSRKSTDISGIGRRVPLDYFDDVKKVAFSRNVEPTDQGAQVTSLHAHSLALATLTGFIILLAAGTSFCRRTVGWLVMLSALGLFVDLGSWMLARSSASFVYTIVGGGVVYGVCTGLVLLAILIDLWLPQHSR